MYDARELKWSVESVDNVYRSLVTFAPAVGSLACVRMAIVENDKKYLRSFSLLLLLLFAVSALIAQDNFVNNRSFSLCLMIVTAIAAAIMLWISGSDDVGLMDNPDPEQQIGGDTDEPLVGDDSEYDISSNESE